jgi:peptide/nickel transport system substrate-binding protein
VIKRLCSGLLLLALLQSVVLAPAGSAQTQTPAAQPKTGGTLTVAWGFDPKVLNVNWVWDHGAAFISQLVYDPLVRFGQDSVVRPGLAKSWETSADGKTWTFHLYDNVKWHDGQKFTSADVKWTLDTVTSEKGPVASGLSFAAITNIATPDDNTVVITLSRPASHLLEDLSGSSNNAGGILPKHLWEGTDLKTNKYNFEPVGTGAFKFVEHKEGDHLTFTANPDYYRGRPYLDNVVFKIVPNIASALAAMESGEAQFMYPRPPFNEVKRFQDTVPGVKTDLYFSGYMWWMEFNERDTSLAPALHSPNKIQVRQALAMAIDRSDINQKILLGYGKPADGAIVSTSPWFNPNATQPKFDPDAAERSLDELGFKRDANGIRFPLELMIISGWEGGAGEAMANVVKSHLAKIGVDVHIKQVELATTFSLREAGAWDTFLGSNSRGPGFETLASDIPSSGFSNWRGFKDPVVDGLFEQGEATLDPAQQKDIYNKLQTQLTTDLTQLNLAQSPLPWMYRDEYQGFFFQDGTISNLMDLSKVYWTKAGGSSTAAASTVGGVPTENLVAGAAVIVLLAIGGVFLVRRRRTTA